MRAKRGMVSIAIMVALFLPLLVFVAPTAQASQPVLPTAFYGDVTVNGSPAPVGTVITGRIVAAAGSPGEGSIEVTLAGDWRPRAGSKAERSNQ